MSDDVNDKEEQEEQEDKNKPQLTKIKIDLKENNILGGRVESGPLQFNDDWPGVFIRGDSALYYSYVLSNFLSKNFEDQKPMDIRCLTNLLNELSSCNIRNLD